MIPADRAVRRFKANVKDAAIAQFLILSGLYAFVEMFARTVVRQGRSDCAVAGAVRFDPYIAINRDLLRSYPTSLLAIIAMFHALSLGIIMAVEWLYRRHRSSFVQAEAPLLQRASIAFFFWGAALCWFVNGQLYARIVEFGHQNILWFVFYAASISFAQQARWRFRSYFRRKV